MENVSSSNGLEKCPKLRFPGFTEPWQDIKLSDVCSYRNKRTTVSKVKYVSTENMLQNYAGLEPYTEDIETEGIAILSDDTLLANIRPYLKKVWKSEFNGACSTDVLAFSPEQINSNFLYSLIAQDKFIDYVMSGAKGSKMPRGDKTHIMDYITSIPTEKEQQKISRFVELINKRIAAQTHYIELLKKYKRGLFETVFTQKIRLVKKTKTWEKIRLSEFANRITRKNGQQTDIPLTISAQYGLIDQRDFFSKTVASADMSNYYLLKTGEFAYNRSTSNEYPFGSIKRLEKYPMGAVSTLYLCFSIDTDIVNSDFIKLFFESAQWHRQIREICAEGARNHGLLNVPTDGFFDCCFTLPRDMEEQEAIAKFLTNIQSKLDSELLNANSGSSEHDFR